MRTVTDEWWERWDSGGPFFGEDGTPHTRVTVETDWELRKSTDPIGTYIKGPIRYYICDGNPQVETEVPNIASVNIERSIDTDAASCTISIFNQQMDINTGGQNLELGNPGYYTWDRGTSAQSAARWGHTVNAWSGVLTPNALLRTYQGFGGTSKTIPQAVQDGNIILTGVWLVDDVQVGTNGMIELRCRDMAKLVIEQMAYPPLIPHGEYPLTYCRYIWKNEQVTETRLVQSATAGQKRAVFSLSGNQAWYGPSGAVHGHAPTDALDGNTDTFWVSVGNSGPNEPYSVEYIQVECGEAIDTVYVHPWAGNYNLYISVMENGVWQGVPTIPYQPLHIGRYNPPTYTATIPYVQRVGVGWETPVTVRLDRAYNADQVRITFTNLARSPWGPYPYRAGVREFRLHLSADQNVTESFTHTVTRRYDGNYKDYADIVKDLLLWSGFWLCDDLDSDEDPEVYGNIESTGAFSEECIARDFFDKRPIIDAINQLKEIVGYLFWVDDEGGARFESPNWWRAGNFNEAGEYTAFIPEIDEQKQLTDYALQYSDRPARSEIIISTEDPTAEFSSTITTRYVPKTADILRGIVRPAMWVNGVFTNEDEQRIMAELIALHIWFSQRQGSVTCVANPAIQINDQVRIYERVTGESYTHYVRGVSTTHDLNSGTYTMNLTTHWLGDKESWAITREDIE